MRRTCGELAEILTEILADNSRNSRGLPGGNVKFSHHKKHGNSSNRKDTYMTSFRKWVFVLLTPKTKNMDKEEDHTNHKMPLHQRGLPQS